MCAGCGTLGAFEALADGAGLSLAAGARLSLAGAPPDGAADAQPNMARASAAPMAASTGGVLIRLVWRVLGSALAHRPRRSKAITSAGERIRVRAGPLVAVQG